MINVTIYVRPDCVACEQALTDLESLQADIPHRLIKLDVDKDRTLNERYGNRLPVVEIGPYRLWSPFGIQDLRVMLSAARDRVTQLEKVDQAGYQRTVAQNQSFTFSDSLSLWLSKHYLLLVNLIIFIYVGLPFLAPTLLKAQVPLAANVIYKIYSPMCHQLAFRSWFLFGEQPYYPRALAEVPNVLPYEETIGEVDIMSARNFTGNETIGYKVALCQRDVAIYGAMVAFGLLYAAVGRRMVTIPWYVWVVLGMGPMGLDGVSQLPSIASNLPAWLPVRESTPLLRSITGLMFGWVTAWYLYPMIEETMRETRRIVQRKKAIVQEMQSSRAE